LYFTMDKRSRKNLYLGIYLILLFVSAFTRDLGLYRIVSGHAGAFAAAFVEPLWKGIFWIAPVVLFITYVERQPVLEYLKLNRHVGRGLLWGLAGSCFYSIQLVYALLHRFPFQLQHSFDDWLNGVILVGIIEEIIFRGFLFQQFETLFKANRQQGDHTGHEMQVEEDEVGEDVSLWIWMADWLVYWYSRAFPDWGTFLAASLSTAIFVAIHLPAWLLSGVPPWIMFTTSLVNVVLGYLSCALFRISGSLWSSIVLHSLNDLITLLLV